MADTGKIIGIGGIGCCALSGFPLIFGIFVFITVLFSTILGGNPGNDSAGSSTASGPCGDVVDTLVDGFQMMPTTGKLGLEQHLFLSSGETASEHYRKSNTPPYARNGMAGGYGGLNTGPPTIENERWASNTQWRWWLTSSGHTNPCLDQKCQQARAKTPHARIVITNNKTHKSVVTSAEESGPALWVTQQDGRNWGATKEVWHYIGASPYPSITVAFAKNQNTPLGPCNN